MSTRSEEKKNYHEDLEMHQVLLYAVSLILKDEHILEILSSVLYIFIGYFSRHTSIYAHL